MTARQARFVEEYLIDLNATQAAIRAGYSPLSAESDGPRMLGNPSINAAIEERKARRVAKSGITQARVLEELAGLAFSDIRNYRIDDAGNLHLAPGAPRNAMAAISSVKRKVFTDDEGRSTVEVEFKLWGKTEPLKLVGRHVDVKGVVERVEHTGAGGGPIEYSEMTSEEKRAALKALAVEADAREAPPKE